MIVHMVTGTFDDAGGKGSKIGNLLSMHLRRLLFKEHKDVLFLEFNGGPISDLDTIIESYTHRVNNQPSIIIWIPNIDNSVDKYLPRIKEICPKTLLVSSKRVIEKQYTDWDVVGRLLKTKSNLGITISPSRLGIDVLHFKLLDPLGNLWVSTVGLANLADALVKRLSYLLKVNRVGSIQIGESRDFKLPEDFLGVVRGFGEKFHEYINAVNPNRFLGNASTRCMAGFPGIKTSGRYFVSKRNVEKSSISEKDFVEVTSREDEVEYYGSNKPSVDTPIQVALFNYYKHINYIIHGHVYILDAPITRNCVPCGAAEEFLDIHELHPDGETNKIIVNLRGHGCLMMVESLDMLENIEFYSRPFPEFQRGV